jgi:hypothetical protein
MDRRRTGERERPRGGPGGGVARVGRGSCQLGTSSEQTKGRQEESMVSDRTPPAMELNTQSLILDELDARDSQNEMSICKYWKF